MYWVSGLPPSSPSPTSQDSWGGNQICAEHISTAPSTCLVLLLWEMLFLFLVFFTAVQNWWAVAQPRSSSLSYLLVSLNGAQGFCHLCILHPVHYSSSSNSP